MKKFTKLTGIIALAAIIGFLMAACDNGGGTGGTGGGGGSSNSIVNKQGEAWLQSPEFEDGYIFKSDGTCIAILELEVNDVGRYTISGNKVSLDGDDPMTFSVSGDTLTLSYNGYTFDPFKRKPISVGW